MNLQMKSTVTILSLLIVPKCVAQSGSSPNWTLIGPKPEYQVKVTKVRLLNEAATTGASVLISDPDLFFDIAHPTLVPPSYPYRFEHRWMITCLESGIVTPAGYFMTCLAISPEHTTGIVTITPPLGLSDVSVPNTSICTGGHDRYILNLQAPVFLEGEIGPIMAGIEFSLDDTGPTGHPAPNAVFNARDGEAFPDPETGLTSYWGRKLNLTYQITKAPPGPKN